MADFSAALGALKRGLKVRREGWREAGFALQVIKDGADVDNIVLLHKDGSHSDLEAILTHNLLATDWEHIPE